MALTDLQFPVTAKSIGPSITPATRDFKPSPRVFYLKSADLLKVEPDVTRNAVTIKVAGTQKKVALFETPDELGAAQAMAQGATAAPNYVKHVAQFTATSSATAADSAALKYYNQVTTNVASSIIRLPDPFAGRRLIVIDNLTTGAISVLGRGTTSPINGTTAAYSIGSLERIHFVAPTAATAGTTVGWKVARDPGA